jgi:hypothetical protein
MINIYQLNIEYLNNLLKFPINKKLELKLNSMNILFEDFYNSLYFRILPKSIYSTHSQDYIISLDDTDEMTIETISPYIKNEFIAGIEYIIHNNSEIESEILKTTDVIITKSKTIEIDNVITDLNFRRLSLANRMLRYLFKIYGEYCHFMLKVVPFENGIGFETTDLFYNKLGFKYVNGFKHHERWKN